ncbi:S-Ena type endospore appendage [Virgibacillus chiguensis]|uniref:Endospore appendages core domain-containing protein n=1 Tax=Virgibacillus chiguensis TaxID=411959 RepID=A0A1M5X814_9BACI|nr:S-Ena type endospore appendage [Virgibacillus chiguensis]SHH95916.1 hypothetical protein SAMN05421807_12244 [Virgibacillus chiguensis]
MTCNFSAKDAACIGSREDRSTAELLKTNLCLPLRQPCDDILRIIFISGALPIINGIFTISNTSLDCVMTVEVTDANGAAVGYTILSQSSIAISVESLTLIQLSCTGETGPDPSIFCSGAFEANLNYCVSC